MEANCSWKRGGGIGFPPNWDCYRLAPSSRKYSGSKHLSRGGTDRGNDIELGPIRGVIGTEFFIELTLDLLFAIIELSPIIICTAGGMELQVYAQ